MGGASPIAQRVRPVAPKFREKLADLIKGLLSAKIIRPSTSPWASPIVVVIKKNGEDILLCIDYRRVNQLKRLMVYPMPLISAFTRHGQSNVVLLTGYGKRVLGSGDDGTSKKYFRIHYAISLV